jgi:sulfide:quinone oxidoreductase
MNTETPNPKPQRVVIAGGGVAALETVLALHDLAPELTDVTVIAPNSDFHYQPMTVREPFAQGPARRYPLAPIVSDAGASLLCDELAWIDPENRLAHTKGDEQLEYDALVLALGAKATPRYRHAVTIDPARMDEILHGIVQDVETGYIKSLAFVAPGRMAWPLPLYELALMTDGRAYDMNVDVAITLITP